jgi:anthraniloyl-CoA monooxygenase
MRALIVGAGPAGLSLATLLAETGHWVEVTIVERNTPDESTGWGVTLRSNALSFLGLGDAVAMPRLQGRALYYRGERVVDLPNPPDVHLATVSRAELLRALRERSTKAGVQLRFGIDGSSLSDLELAGYDLVVAADGASSAVRQRFPEAFQPRVIPGRNRYAWLATPALFRKLTILVRDEDVPLLAWVYQYSETLSTLIIECADATYERSSLFKLSPEACCAALARIFQRELGGQPVLSLPSMRWQHFPILSCRRLVHQNLVLVGDSAHTTHYSQGFGTMFAFDDALTLHTALAGTTDIRQGLAAYEAAQQPKIENYQQISVKSMQWAETMVDAAVHRDEGKVFELIAARWPNNAVTDSPMSAES